MLILKYIYTVNIKPHFCTILGSKSEYSFLSHEKNKIFRVFGHFCHGLKTCTRFLNPGYKKMRPYGKNPLVYNFKDIFNFK